MYGCQNKHDLSDVIGILVEHQESGDVISLKAVERSVVVLCGDLEKFLATSHSIICAAIEHPNLSEVYEQINRKRTGSKNVLVSFEERYHGVTTMGNVDEILTIERSRTERDN